MSIDRNADAGTPTTNTINNPYPASQGDPQTPIGFFAKVFARNLQVYIRLQASVRKASIRNPGAVTSATVRFYFVADSLAPIASLTTRQAVAGAFAKASLIVQTSASFGPVSYTFPADQFPPGSFFCTSLNPASLDLGESAPAGPIQINQDAVKTLENSFPPPDVSLVSSPFLVPLDVPMTNLKYWNVVFQILAPDPPDTFDGLTIWTYGYFENVTATNVLVESGYYKYVITDPQIPSLGMTVKMPFLGDYDSTSSEPGLNVPHPVTFYFVAESKGRTYLPPVTSRPQFTFTNGIGA